MRPTSQQISGGRPFPSYNEALPISRIIASLRLLARQKFKTVELFRIDMAQGTHEPFDALVARGKRVLVNEILVDSLSVSLQANLFFDPLPKGLAQRTGEIEVASLRQRGLKSRWSREWRSLVSVLRADGRGGGGICGRGCACRKIAM